MLREVYENGFLTDRWDDATRTYTDFRTEPDTTRPYTAQENADADARATEDAPEATRAALLSDTGTDLTRLREAIDALALLLADDTTVGSIRNIMGPSGAAAGTTSLRALRQQNNTNVVSAIKAFLDHAISLAQLAIDDAQATRKVARQVLREAKITAGDYSSADVGVEAANAQG